MERKSLVKRCLFLVLLAIIFLVVIFIMAKYEEEGEKENEAANKRDPNFSY